MKRTIIILLAISLMLIFSACNEQTGRSNNEEASESGKTEEEQVTEKKKRITLAGSTSVQIFIEYLAEEYEAKLNKEGIRIIIDVEGGGSSAGFTAVSCGIADIGMSSRSLRDSEVQEFEGRYKQIAIDGLAVIVHPSNPVNDLTKEQIRDIYTHEITNWKDVGGPDKKIHVITREEASGTRDAFQSLVMGEDHEINVKSNTQQTNGTIKSIIAVDDGAIGYISLGLVDEKVKALIIDGVEASDENIKSNAYKLWRPFIFVMSENISEDTKKFVDFVLSDEGQTILVREGLISPT